MSIFNREETEMDKKVKAFQVEELQKKKQTLLKQKKAMLLERKEREETRQLKREVSHLTNERRFAPLYGAAREGKRVYKGFQNMAKKTGSSSNKRSSSSNRGLDWGSGGGMSLGMGGLQDSSAGQSLMAGFSGKNNKHGLSFGREPERVAKPRKKSGKTIIIKY